MPEICETLASVGAAKYLDIIKQAEKAVRTEGERAKVQTALAKLAGGKVDSKAVAVDHPCSGCGSAVHINPKQAGRSMQCPKCGVKFIAPALQPSFSDVAGFGGDFLDCIVTLSIQRGYGDPMVSPTDKAYYLYPGLDPAGTPLQVAIRTQRGSPLDSKVRSMPEASTALFTGAVCEDRRIENRYALTLSDIADGSAEPASTRAFQPPYPDWMVVPVEANSITIAADCEVLPWETFSCPKCTKPFGDLPANGPGVKYVFNYGMRGIAGGKPQSFAKVWWTEVQCCGQKYLVSNRGK